MTKKRETKKLTPRARKKELTGINLAALKREIETLKEFWEYLEKRLTKLERRK